MLALVVQMNAAREINFLNTPMFHEEPEPWRLGQWLNSSPLFSKFSKSETNTSKMLAVDGGFVFERELSFTIPSGLASGVIGMSVFILIGSLIASDSLSSTLLARAIEATQLTNTAVESGLVAGSAAQSTLAPKEDQVSAKKAQPSSSSSTVGT